MDAWRAHRTRFSLVLESQGASELCNYLTSAGGRALYSPGKGRGKVSHRPRDCQPGLPTLSPLPDPLDSQAGPIQLPGPSTIRSPRNPLSSTWGHGL